MRNLTKMLFAAGLIVLGAGCQKQEEGSIAVREVKLDRTQATVEEDKSITLAATVLPENATDKTCTWESSDTDVATVDENGVVSAVSAGTAVINVKAGEVKTECEVTVTASQILAKSARFDQTEISIPLGSTYILTLVTDPEQVTEEAEWSSSNPEVATIGPDGTVKAEGVGNCNVQVRFKTSNVSASCSVKVNEVFSLYKVDASLLVTNDDKPSDNLDTIRVARGEVADFQIIVKANMPVGELKTELVYFGKDGDESGILIQPRLFWERDVYCSRYWEKWEGGAPYNEITPSDRKFPDALMPLDKWSVSLAKGKKTGIWCDFYVPYDFEDGLFSGEIKVSGKYNGNENVAMTKKFYVQVYPIAVPDLRHQNLYVVNWHGFRPEYLNNKEAVSPELEKQLQEELFRFMHDYRQNVFRTDHSLNWPRAYNDNGQLKLDYSEMLAKMQFLVDNNPDIKQIHGIAFTGKNEEGKIKCTAQYLSEDGEVRSYTYRYDDERLHAYIAACAKELGSQLAARRLPNGKTWLESYAQNIFDEPWDDDVEGWEAIASYIKEGCPEMKTLEPIQTGKISPQLLDYPCPDLDVMEYPEYHAHDGQQQWIYTCLRPQGNIANRLFGQPLIYTRLIHWCNFHYNAVGYLHWGLCYWNIFDDPFNDDAHNAEKGGNMPGGDCFIVYPGYREFYPSLRLCNMRDGINDYELLRMLEEKDPVKAREIAGKVVYQTPQPLSNPPTEGRISGKFKFYNSGIKNFRNCRREILEELSR